MPRPSCLRCARPVTHCLCAAIPSVASRSSVLILQHPSEVGHALNTARLLALGLNNAQLLVGEVFDDLAERLNRPSHEVRLLFPGEQAEPLNVAVEAVNASSMQPFLLVVPDGTWRKARKLLHLNPCLAALPRVCLPAGGVSRYRLRKAPHPGALATIEAVVQALEIIESPKRFDALLQPFEQLIAGQIQAMGDDIYTRHHGTAGIEKADQETPN